MEHSWITSNTSNEVDWDERISLVFRDRKYFEDILDFVVLTKVNFDKSKNCNYNTYHKYVAFKRKNKRILSVRKHGRIGMPPLGDSRIKLSNLEQFRQHVDDENFFRQFYHVKMIYINANHLVHNQPESCLPEAVKNLLVRLIDEYMPTGILNINEVLQAEDILRDIRQQLEANEHVDNNLSEKFYQIIPQNGNLDRLEVINNWKVCRNKIEYLDRLRSALKVIYQSLVSLTNPIDYFTRYWLRTELCEVNRRSKEFYGLDHCTQKTQHPNRRFFSLINAFKVTSSADIQFANDIPNQRLLYHFTFPCNILGILREGLQAAPQHIYSKNRFLGPGIYFWDCASMALSAFERLPEETSPVLLVCRVALGAVQKVPHQYLSPGEVLPLPDNKNSFYCRGMKFSNVTSNTVDFGDAKMYCGEVGELRDYKFDNYNKYMVQNKHQVKIEYILQFLKKSLARGNGSNAI